MDEGTAIAFEHPGSHHILRERIADSGLAGLSELGAPRRVGKEFRERPRQLAV